MTKIKKFLTHSPKTGRKLWKFQLKQLWLKRCSLQGESSFDVLAVIFLPKKESYARKIRKKIDLIYVCWAKEFLKKSLCAIKMHSWQTWRQFLPECRKTFAQSTINLRWLDFFPKTISLTPPLDTFKAV